MSPRLITRVLCKRPSKLASKLLENICSRERGRMSTTHIGKRPNHRLIAVVHMVGGEIYHVVAKQQLHQLGRKYDEEVPVLLKLAFGFTGFSSQHCLETLPRYKTFIHEGEEWHPRHVDWTITVSHSALVELGHIDTSQCDIWPEEESPFRDLIRQES